MLALASVRLFEPHHDRNFDRSGEPSILIFHAHMKWWWREGERLIRWLVNRIQRVAPWIVSMPIRPCVAGLRARCHAEIEPSCRKFVGRHCSFYDSLTTRCV